MYLDKFVHNTTGKIIMSILLGLGLATFFRAICRGKNCKVIKSPALEEIDDQIFKFDGKCFKMEKNAVKCDNRKNIVKFA
jgi:hypothetical protein